MENKKNRNVNLDCIRAFAVFSVICIHFFLNSQFYTNNLTGKKMFIGLYLKTFFMVCVPLFLLLSGYLMNKKKIDKNYYKKIYYILLTYLVVSIIQIFFSNIFLNASISLKESVLFILGFKTHYSWYINMYIGLFMLIPFLNIIYNNLKNQKEKQILILTFVFLTVFPSIFNAYDFKINNFFIHPTISKNYDVIVPNWWINIWPITYYFIGCYLNEYQIKLKIKKNILFIIIMTFIFSLYQLYRSYPNNLVLDSYSSDWNGIFTIMLSIFTFILFINIKFNNLPKFLNLLIKKISEVSLPLYMISWIFDTIIYNNLNNKIHIIQNRIIYFLPTVLLVFVCSFLLAIFTDYITKFILRKVDNLCKKN